MNYDAYPGGMTRALRNHLWFFKGTGVYKVAWPAEDPHALINEFVDWIAANYDVRGKIELPRAELNEAWVRWGRERVPRG